MSFKTLLVLAFIATFVAIAVAEVLREDNYQRKYGNKKHHGSRSEYRNYGSGSGINQFFECLTKLWVKICYFFALLINKICGNGNCKRRINGCCYSFCDIEIVCNEFLLFVCTSCCKKGYNNDYQGGYDDY